MVCRCYKIASALLLTVSVYKKLIYDYGKKNYNNVLWYQEQIFLFQDEIENMC